MGFMLRHTVKRIIMVKKINLRKILKKQKVSQLLLVDPMIIILFFRLNVPLDTLLSSWGFAYQQQARNDDGISG